MKAYSRTNRHQTALGLPWVVLCLLFLSGCGSVQIQQPPPPTQAQEQSPPTPQEPVTNLQMPMPVTTEAIKGRATLPEALPLGFAVDVADIVLGGDWDIRGTVLAFEDRIVSFRTDKGEIGHLVFRLPEGIRFPPLRPEQPISIQRKLRGYGPSLGYELQVTSTERLVLASGSIAGGEPQTVNLGSRVSLQQGSERTAVLSESKYETTYQVPVVLNLDGIPRELPIGRSIEFSADGAGYLLMVTQSNEVRPTKEQEGSDVSTGYNLQYVLALK
jgi:hypothetical protein